MDILTEVCLYLKNWFDRGQKKYLGRFEIVNGTISYLGGTNMEIQTGQYYRIEGSVFNNGVHQKGKETLKDEAFTGSVWGMAVPPSLIGLVAEIQAWQEKYGNVNSANMSPLGSENFAGVYSYTKASGGSSNSSSSSVPTWQSVFADRLGRYKKI